MTLWNVSVWLFHPRFNATNHINTTTDTSTTMPVLLPGVPLAGDTPLNKFTYYQLRGMAGGYEDFDVIVTVTAGGASCVCPCMCD